MWKEENKEIAILTINNSLNMNDFRDLINEQIIKQKYKFYILGDKNYKYYEQLRKVISDSNLEWEFFELPSSKEEKIDFYNSIDFGIHIGKEKELFNSNAKWLIFMQNEMKTKNKNNKENYYFAYDLKDVKDILIFFAANNIN